MFCPHHHIHMLQSKWCIKTICKENVAKQIASSKRFAFALSFLMIFLILINIKASSGELISIYIDRFVKFAIDIVVVFEIISGHQWFVFKFLDLPSNWALIAPGLSPRALLEVIILIVVIIILTIIIIIITRPRPAGPRGIVGRVHLSRVHFSRLASALGSVKKSKNCWKYARIPAF